MWGSGWRSLLQQALSPVEAVVGAVGHGQDGRVCQLPHPRVALLLAGTEAQVRDLADHLDEVLQVLVSSARELARAGIQGGGMGHDQHLVSSVFAVRQDVLGHLVATANVALVGLRDR